MTALAQHDQSAAGEVEPARPGRTEFGMIRIDDRVVARLAAQAALEISDAGAAAPRVLGRVVSGVGALGIRQTSLSALPKANAEVRRLDRPGRAVHQCPLAGVCPGRRRRRPRAT